MFNKKYDFEEGDQNLQPEYIKNLKDFYVNLERNLDKLFLSRGFNSSNNIESEYEKIISDQIADICDNNYMIGTAIKEKPELIDKEISSQLNDPNLNRVDLLVAVRNVISDDISNSILNNEYVLVERVAENVAYKTFFNDLNKKLIEQSQTEEASKENESTDKNDNNKADDLTPRFFENELLDGDVNGEVLFKRLGAGTASFILSEINEGLINSEPVKEVSVFLCNKLNENEPNINLENVQKSLTERVKEICQEKGLYFDFSVNKENKVQPDPDKKNVAVREKTVLRR